MVLDTGDPFVSRWWNVCVALQPLGVVTRSVADLLVERFVGVCAEFFSACTVRFNVSNLNFFSQSPGFLDEDACLLSWKFNAILLAYVFHRWCLMLAILCCLGYGIDASHFQPLGGVTRSLVEFLGFHAELLVTFTLSPDSWRQGRWYDTESPSDFSMLLIWLIWQLSLSPGVLKTHAISCFLENCYVSFYTNSKSLVFCLMRIKMFPFQGYNRWKSVLGVAVSSCICWRMVKDDIQVISCLSLWGNTPCSLRSIMITGLPRRIWYQPKC